MSRTDTTQDSSMEEILASIRRIISEDAGPAAFAAEPARKPTAAASPPPVRPVDFGQLPIPAFSATVRPAAVVTPGAPPFAVAAQLAPVPPAATDDDDILDLDASYAAVTRRPSAEAAAPAPTLALVREAIVTGPAIPASALVDAAPLDELLQPDPDPMPEPLAAAPEPEAAPVLASPPSVPEPVQAAALDISEPVRAESAVVAGPPAAEISAPVLVLAEPVVAAETAPPAYTSAMATILVEPLAAALPVDLTPAAAMAEAVAHRAPEIAAALAAAEVAPVVAAPAVIAPPPIAAAPVAARTMEDMVAEMLRPMLRDWLDSNMPRIIEKTLAKPGE